MPPAPSSPAPTPTPSSTPAAGRYAPSPSGDLHLGNLRTAVIAFTRARDTGRAFHLRIDDIDAQRSSPEAAERQLEDLDAVGVHPLAPAAPTPTHPPTPTPTPPPILRQSEQLAHYAAALASLQDRGLVYECYCTRRDIADAQRAPHGQPGRYPGTCRDLTASERTHRRATMGDRIPALRLRADTKEWTITEHVAGTPPHATTPRPVTGPVDDMVLRRGGTPGQEGYAYNLCVVVDDALAGVDEVVRGDDLLTSAPPQAYLASLLGLPPVEYAHVPLVLGPTARRLAKRDGAVTLRELGADATRAWLATSLLPTPPQPQPLSPAARPLCPPLDSWSALPRDPVTWRP